MFVVGVVRSKERTEEKCDEPKIIDRYIIDFSFFLHYSHLAIICRLHTIIVFRRNFFLLEGCSDS